MGTASKAMWTQQCAHLDRHWADVHKLRKADSPALQLLPDLPREPSQQRRGDCQWDRWESQGFAVCLLPALWAV
jgi:hypothetical protein